MVERVKTAEATVADLRAFAEVMGLEHEPRASRADLLALVELSGFVGETIPRFGGVPIAQRAKGDATGGATRINDAGQEEVCILVHAKDEEGGDHPLMVGFNFSAMLVPRGVPVWVPVGFYRSIRDAEELVYDPGVHGEGGLPPPRAVQSYPFSLVGG